MTAISDSAGWLVVNTDAMTVVMIPALAGIAVQARVAVKDLTTGRWPICSTVAPGGHLSIPLCDLLPAGRFSVQIQTRDDEGVWATRVSGRVPDGLELSEVSPSRWGVHQDCVAVLHDLRHGRLLWRQEIPAGQAARVVCETGDLVRWQLELFQQDPSGERRRLVSPMRWVPPSLLGTPPQQVHQFAEGLGYTVRRDVTLGPVKRRTVRRISHSYSGSILAHEGSIPVVEANEWALGRQFYLYRDPDSEQLDERPEDVVFAGFSHGSFGHFLTQGIARLWYALAHPELPVVWAENFAHEWQHDVLRVLGLRNEQLFLTRPTRFASVVFPFPGIGVGDYVVPQFTRMLGVVDPQPTVPGKKVLLSRAEFDLDRGKIEDDGDRRLDRLAADYGFEVFYPEQHPVDRQLAEISSSQVVLGVESSAFHLPVMLRDPVATRFVALRRHRGGEGVFAHLNAAKQLDYTTLDFLTRPVPTARSPISLDFSRLESVLKATDGLEQNLNEVVPYTVESPPGHQSSFGAQIEGCQVRLTAHEQTLAEAYAAVGAGDLAAATRTLGEYL